MAVQTFVTLNISVDSVVRSLSNAVNFGMLRRHSIAARGTETVHTSPNPHYGLAAILAVALVVIPWGLIAWLIWTLVA
jgi:hypothetical protein